MSTDAAPRGGLRTALDMIVAPDAAFEALRTFPTWGWALIVSAACGMLGAFLALPAAHHALDAALPAVMAKQPQLQALPPAEQQARIASTLRVMHTVTNFNFILVPIIAALSFLIQAGMMLLARVAGRGEGGFRRFWALACNAGIVGIGLSTLTLGIITVIRGPASFNSQIDTLTAIPSLALLAPGASNVVASFLGSFNVFYLWSAALLALGMIRTARIRPVVAWITATLFVLLPALYAAYGASRA